MALINVSSSEAIETALALLKRHWLTLAFIVVTAKVFQSRWLHPLSKFPGPFLGSVTYWYSVYTFFTYRAQELEYNLAKKYGSVFRYQPNTIFISDPKMLPIVYHRSADKDPLFYGTGSLGMGLNVFTAITHEEHTRVRKRVAGTFSMTSIRSMEHIIDDIVQEFQAKMGEQAEVGERFDFARWAQFFTYDVISELTFGRRFGFIEKGEDFHNLVSGLLLGLPLIGLTQRIKFLNSLFTSDWVANKVNPRPTDKSGIGAVMGYRDKLLAQRVEGGEMDGRHDILHHILKSKNADGTPITLDEVKDELLIIMLAATDTTAGTLRSIIYRVLQTPGVYDKMMKELDDAYATGRISKPVITYDECMALPYFMAVFKEVFRFDPSGPSLWPRLVPKGGYHLNGLYVPEGTVVCTNSWVINRNKDFYGEDADVFNPERWLVSEERSKVMENYSFTWGYGARVCLGKNIALMELYKAICQLFLHFTPELVDLEQHGKRINLTNFFQKDMWVKLKPRTPKA